MTNLWYYQQSINCGLYLAINNSITTCSYVDILICFQHFFVCHSISWYIFDSKNLVLCSQHVHIKINQLNCRKATLLKWFLSIQSSNHCRTWLFHLEVISHCIYMCIGSKFTDFSPTTLSVTVITEVMPTSTIILIPKATTYPRSENCSGRNDSRETDRSKVIPVVHGR